MVGYGLREVVFVLLVVGGVEEEGFYYYFICGGFTKEFSVLVLI